MVLSWRKRCQQTIASIDGTRIDFLHTCYSHDAWVFCLSIARLKADEDCSSLDENTPKENPVHSYTDRSIRLDHRHRGSLLRGQSEYITAYHPKQLGPLLKQMMTGIVNWLTTGSMPRISKAVLGETEVWKVVDPMTNRTLYFEEENALRAWMEQRYYQ
jgi:hypothetical protein